MITRLTNSTLRFLLVATLLATSLPAESVRATDGSVATLSAPTDAERSVLVRTRAGVPHDWTTRQAASAGLRFVREVPRLGWYVFEPSGSTSSRAAAAMLRSSALVDRVEVDGVAVTASAPNDPLYPGLWGLNNTGQDGGTPGSDIGAEVAWDVTTGSDDVVVAVIDTGVDLAHPDLAANAWVNTGEIPGNGIDDDGNGYIDDVVGYNFAARNGTVFDPTHVDAHGTHVAGTIGAVGDNGTGVAGVNHDVRIMGLKFISPTSASVSNGAEAIVYAVDNGATILNLSWSTTTYSAMLEDALAYARRHGVIAVVAAANSARNLDVTPEWPAAIEATNVVTVAATDRNDALASFSNRSANIVDVAAPGVDITSTVPIFGAAVHVTRDLYEAAYVAFPIESLPDASTRTALIGGLVSGLVNGHAEEILLVDDSRAVAESETPGGRKARYLQALSAAGYSNVIEWDTATQGAPSLAQTSGRAVVWFTGRTSLASASGMSLDAEDRAAIGAYLDAGGRLLLVGGSVATDLDYYQSARTWFRNYLRVSCPMLYPLSYDAGSVGGGPVAGTSFTVPVTETWGTTSMARVGALVPLDPAAGRLIDWSGYARMSGTSMASPHVAGALALLAAAHPNEKSEELRTRLESTVTHVAPLATSVRTSGRIDVGSAIGEYPAPPRVLAPAEGSGITRGSSATMSFTPRTGADPMATYEMQVATPTESMPNVGFETGSLSGWSSGGSKPFTITSAHGEVYAGVFAARSGAISHSQSSYVQAVISVPTGGAWLHFRYLLDSEDYWDYATLSVNGATKWQGRSDATWESVRVWLQPGSTTLRWTYVKDSYGSEGRDMFALDEVRVTQTAWSAPVAVTPGSTEVMFTVPDIETRSGAVRVRASTGLVTGAWEEVFGVVYTADATPPGVPTALTATPGSDGDISLSWTDPADADWALTRIVRSLTSLPMSPNDGVAVYEGRDGSAHDAPLSHGATAYYAAFARDGVGNWSEAAVVSADVVDETPPPPVGLLQAAREGGNVRLTWMVPAVVDAVGVRVLRTTGAPATGPDDGTAAVVFDGMGTQALDVGVAAAPVEETFYYRAWVRDATPNWSEYRDTSIHIDTLPPTGTFVLAAGAQYATNAAVTADSSVTGASEMRFDTGGGYGSWVPYAATHPLTLVGGDGTRTVTAQYRDAAGNTTSLADSIVLDTIAPPAPAALSVVGSGRDWIEISWSAVAASDVSAYIVSRRPESSATWSGVGTIAHPATSFRDEDLPADTSYRYRVTARDHAGNVGPASTEVPAAVGVPVERLAGTDRYATAIAISKSTFVSAEEIVLATGESYADALGASALAGALDAPVLLTRRDKLSTGVLGEIARLGGTRVVIVGGTSAVSETVERSLQGSGLFTRRIAGVDRYATAAGVAAEALKSRGPVAMPGHVFVVSGEDFADALAVSSAAYAGRVPVLLVRRNGVPQATLQAISSGGYTRAVVVGGPAAVPESVRSRLGVASARVSGADRYATAAAFARWASAAGIVDFETIGLATGRSFPDALGGGAALGAQSGVLLLTDPTALSIPARSAIADHADIAASLRVLGGESAISSAVLSQALIALR